MLKSFFCLRLRGSFVRVAGRRNCSGKSSPPRWLEKFNNNISVNPLTTIPTYLLIRNATWYGLVAGFTQLSLGGPEFAIGYLVSKVTSKFRQPINLSIAALVSKLFPLMSQVKASSLLYIPIPESASSDKSMSKHESVISNLSAWAIAPLDKYGFSFYFSSKLTVFLTIGGTSFMIRQGIDLSDILYNLGVSTTVQDVGGAAGLASMVNVLLIPGQLALLSKVTPFVNQRFVSTFSGRKRDDFGDNGQR